MNAIYSPIAQTLLPTTLLRSSSTNPPHCQHPRHESQFLLLLRSTTGYLWASAVMPFPPFHSLDVKADSQQQSEVSPIVLSEYRHLHVHPSWLQLESSDDVPTQYRWFAFSLLLKAFHIPSAPPTALGETKRLNNNEFLLTTRVPSFDQAFHELLPFLCMLPSLFTPTCSAKHRR